MFMSPQEVLVRLIELFPDFAACWNDPDNCFREDDGAFTYCGAFAEFSSYFRDGYEQFSEDKIAALGKLLSECMSVPDSELDTAAATCFLENVTFERFSPEFEKYLCGEPLAFYKRWQGGA